MLAWVDLETTGLDPRTCQVLEVAVVITDDQLNEVGSAVEQIIPHGLDLALLADYPEDVALAYGKLHGVDPYVVDMHRNNGLWQELRSHELELVHNPTLKRWDRDQVDATMAYGVAANGTIRGERAGDDGKMVAFVDRPQLAGSTISFDRGFLQVHLPLFESMLHYRNVDVSSFSEIARRFWPEIYMQRPKEEHSAHRGMADIRESIAVMRHYLGRLTPQAIP